MIPDEFMAADAERVLTGFADQLALASLREPLASAVAVARDGFADNFSKTRGPGYDWPPHSPTTIRIHGPHPLLILSGKMFRSITVAGSDGGIEEIGERDAAIGTDIFYAPFQQHGTIHIPKRRFVWLEGEWVDRAAEAFADGCFSILVGATT